METQFGRKPPLPLFQPSNFIIKKTSYNHVLVQIQTNTQAPTCRRLQPSFIYQPLLEGSYNPLHSFTSLSWKGATTPCTPLPASPGRELLPPDNFYWQKASTFILKASTLRSTANHISSIFKLDQTAPTQPFICQ